MAAQQKHHIGKMIKAVFEESGLSVTELARRIHTARSNVYFIFERPSIDLNQLLDICDALNHNFLDDILLQRGMKSKLCPRKLCIELDFLFPNNHNIMNEFLNLVFERFEKQITDNIFCFVQNDKELMKFYLDLVAERGDLQYVNSHIAQEIAKRYGLKNIGLSGEKPKSNYIQTFSELRK